MSEHWGTHTMANQKHLQMVLSGQWTAWKAANPTSVPDLVGADLSGADLRSAKLVEADCNQCRFSGADLRNADFSKANLTGAKLWGARVGKTTFPGSALHWQLVLSLVGGFIKPKAAGRN